MSGGQDALAAPVRVDERQLQVGVGVDDPCRVVPERGFGGAAGGETPVVDRDGVTADAVRDVPGGIETDGGRRRGGDEDQREEQRNTSVHRTGSWMSRI